MVSVEFFIDTIGNRPQYGPGAERGLWERGIPLYGSSFREPGGGCAPFTGPLKVMKGRLWGWVSLLMGALLGNLE
jgi:hypothetical protein